MYRRAGFAREFIPELHNSLRGPERRVRMPLRTLGVSLVAWHFGGFTAAPIESEKAQQLNFDVEVGPNVSPNIAHPGRTDATEPQTDAVVTAIRPEVDTRQGTPNVTVVIQHGPET